MDCSSIEATRAFRTPASHIIRLGTNPKPRSQLQSLNLPLSLYHRPNTEATRQSVRQSSPSAPEQQFEYYMPRHASATVEKTRKLLKNGISPNRAYCRAITPRSVRPFTKNCTANATSSNPIMRTRILMPVSPKTRRTRSAPLRTP